MKTLTIKNRFQGNATVIENEFIDTYMVKANGEFVKVYLFLLRHLNSPTSSITISIIADRLEDTEKDILRALKYWEKIGLLSIVYDEEKKITGLELDSVQYASNRSSVKIPKEETAGKEETIGNEDALPSVAPQKASTPISSHSTSHTSKSKIMKNSKELKQLLFVAEQYLGKTLTKTDIDTIYYFYDSLHFTADLIEYLIEYCVENNHKSMHYIQSVALAWSKAQVSTIDEAKANSCLYNKNYFTVLKAFGITGRGPVTSEKKYIDGWMNQSGFTLDIIKEACDRTMASIHQPSFEYADSILSNWKEKGVLHLSDILTLDEAYKKEKTAVKKVVSKPVASNKFNNFQGRSYDIDSLEEQLLNSK
ncbi:DnaD domain protein [Lachnospiraceae bacterium LCP25S3_G4]